MGQGFAPQSNPGRRGSFAISLETCEQLLPAPRILLQELKTFLEFLPVCLSSSLDSAKLYFPNSKHLCQKLFAPFNDTNFGAHVILLTFFITSFLKAIYT